MLDWLSGLFGRSTIELLPPDPMSASGLLIALKFDAPLDSYYQLRLTASEFSAHLQTALTCRPDYDGPVCFERVRALLASGRISVRREPDRALEVLLSILPEVPDPYPTVQIGMHGCWLLLAADSDSITATAIRMTDELIARVFEAVGIATDGAAYVRESREWQRLHDEEEALLGLPPGWAEARAQQRGQV